MKKLLIFIAIVLLIFGLAVADRYGRGDRNEDQSDGKSEVQDIESIDEGLVDENTVDESATDENVVDVTSSGECNCDNGQVCCGSDTDKPGMCVGNENACYIGPDAGNEGRCGNDNQCDDGNPCTYDICVSSTRPGHCLNARIPLGAQCLDGYDGYCDRNGNCVSHGLGCAEGFDDCDGNGDCECPGTCDSSGCCNIIIPTTCKEIGESCDPTNNNCCFGRCEYMPPGAYWCIGECWPNKGACYSNDVCCSNCCYGGECRDPMFCS